MSLTPAELARRQVGWLSDAKFEQLLRAGPEGLAPEAWDALVAERDRRANMPREPQAESPLVPRLRLAGAVFRIVGVVTALVLIAVGISAVRAAPNLPREYAAWAQVLEAGRWATALVAWVSALVTLWRFLWLAWISDAVAELLARPPAPTA